MKKIYIAGPMSGIDKYNFPAFNRRQKILEAQGWKVFNPANKDTELKVIEDPSYKKGDADALMKSGFNFRKVFTWDVDRVIEADAIYMLKGWEKSPGARAEHAVACAMQTKYPTYEIFYEASR